MHVATMIKTQWVTFFMSKFVERVNIALRPALAFVELAKEVAPEWLGYSTIDRWGFLDREYGYTGKP